MQNNAWSTWKQLKVALHGMDNCCLCSNATLLMNLRHIVEIHSGELLHASGSVLLIVASNFRGFVALLTTTALGFLYRVDPLESVSNYYVHVQYTDCWFYKAR